MGSFSIWHWLIVLLVVLVLFGGGGKLSRLMGDMARGINSFKKGLKETEPSGEGRVEGEAPPKEIRTETAARAGEAKERDEAAKG